jgi:hypothetical protein
MLPQARPVSGSLLEKALAVAKASACTVTHPWLESGVLSAATVAVGVGGVFAAGRLAVDDTSGAQTHWRQ